jgi:DNA-binding GntR family transcriptional regulator
MFKLRAGREGSLVAREYVAPRWRRAGPSGDGRATDQLSPSLVDSAEEALHIWLAGGRHRQGDRLPPEHEVATMLGISRGTLRSALRRLEERGEIVRRQGSGTFVGRNAVPAALREQLEAGQMVLDVLISIGVPVTYARTRVIPSLPSPRERAGKLLGVKRTTAVLELEELYCAGREERVAYSRDLFAPGGLDATVMRSFESTRPTPIANVRGARAAAGRARRARGNGA